MSHTPPDSQPPHKHVILIGVRGSGKTTVGRMLAARLARPFLDTDESIERTTGKTIRDLFANDGEARFRALEASAIQAALQGPVAVVSVGGGAILFPATRELLRECSICIWLRAAPAELLRRIQDDPRTATQRPPLTDAAGEDEIVQILTTRTPLYADPAHALVDTDGKTIAEVVDEVAAALHTIAQGGRRP